MGSQWRLGENIKKKFAINVKNFDLMNSGKVDLQPISPHLSNNISRHSKTKTLLNNNFEFG